MARTRASVGAKIASGKSSKARCCAPAPAAVSSSSTGSSKSSRDHSSGNPMCPRETPKWQKPITNFFITNGSRTQEKSPVKENDKEDSDKEERTAGPSKPKKRNIIESDSGSDEERPTNRVLDETIELEPLTGENNTKIPEYYSKGKGVGKKTKEQMIEKENIDSNKKEEKRSSVKRKSIDNEGESVSKKVKL